MKRTNTRFCSGDVVAPQHGQRRTAAPAPCCSACADVRGWRHSCACSRFPRQSIGRPIYHGSGGCATRLDGCFVFAASLGVDCLWRGVCACLEAAAVASSAASPSPPSPLPAPRLLLARRPPRKRQVELFLHVCGARPPYGRTARCVCRRKSCFFARVVTPHCPARAVCCRKTHRFANVFGCLIDAPSSQTSPCSSCYRRKLCDIPCNGSSTLLRGPKTALVLFQRGLKKGGPLLIGAAFPPRREATCIEATATASPCSRARPVSRSRPPRAAGSAAWSGRAPSRRPATATRSSTPRTTRRGG